MNLIIRESLHTEFFTLNLSLSSVCNFFTLGSFFSLICLMLYEWQSYLNLRFVWPNFWEFCWFYLLGFNSSMFNLILCGIDFLQQSIYSMVSSVFRLDFFVRWNTLLFPSLVVRNLLVWLNILKTVLQRITRDCRHVFSMNRLTDTFLRLKYLVFWLFNWFSIR